MILTMRPTPDVISIIGASISKFWLRILCTAMKTRIPVTTQISSTDVRAPITSINPKKVRKRNIKVYYALYYLGIGIKREEHKKLNKRRKHPSKKKVVKTGNTQFISSSLTTKNQILRKTFFLYSNNNVTHDLGGILSYVVAPNLWGRWNNSMQNFTVTI